MAEPTINTNKHIIDRMVKILEQQRNALELFRQSSNKHYLSQYQILSAEFQELNKQLKEQNTLGT